VPQTDLVKKVVSFFVFIKVWIAKQVGRLIEFHKKQMFFEHENQILKQKLENFEKQLTEKENQIQKIQTSSGQLCKGCFETVKKATEVKDKWKNCSKCEQKYCDKCSDLFLYTSFCCKKLVCGQCTVKLVGCEQHARTFYDTEFDNLYERLPHIIPTERELNLRNSLFQTTTSSLSSSLHPPRERPG
jgi:hypothetical protein